MALRVFAGFWLFLLLGLAAAQTGQVPLLAWSSHSRSLWPPSSIPHEGHVVTETQLAALLDSALDSGPHNVLLFLQEKLSVEDFTAYGGVFGNKPDSAFPNLENAVGAASSSLVLPSVDWFAASAVPAFLKAKLGISPLHVDQNTLQELRLNASLPALLLIRLPYTTGSSLMAPKEVLTSNDEILGQVLSGLQSEDIPYTAILTALRPSRVVRDVSGLAPERLGRQLLQKETTVAPLRFPADKPWVLFWATNFSVAINDTWHDLTNLTFGDRATVDVSKSTNTQNASELVLSYPSVGGQPLTITFQMTNIRYSVSAQNWFTVRTVVLHRPPNPPATFNGTQITAPSNYSFSCARVSSQPALEGVLVPYKNASHWKVLIVNFQIQSFNVIGDKFSYASDCAGFFSPGIWMGLLTSLLLVAVFTYGLHMVMSLKTMDRFDDPKGPTISVPQTE
ncbi:V-type proton ATPase subunit S1 isoform X1 [Anolis sagrei]|uniref:V-type proton ATPase subunit S1 isoform X1 n=1 Tax=Anolis sagrei TaxID=38937 RepID=UPI0035204841